MSKTLRAAICFGGHFRTTKLYENIKDNIIDILNKNKIETDIFMSIWDTEGHRDNNFEGAIDINNITSIYKPTVIEVEKNNREYFVQTYMSNNVNKKYSGPETSGDSTSMWYKLYGSKKLMSNYETTKGFSYNLIFRVRSDIMMNTPLDINDVYNSLNTNTVYMPVSHGLYLEVTKGMMDHYFFGPRKEMEQILDLYTHIPMYLDMNIPHTAEGFLWKRIETEKIPLKRFTTSYSVLRPNKLELVV